MAPRDLTTLAVCIAEPGVWWRVSHSGGDSDGGRAAVRVILQFIVCTVTPQSFSTALRMRLSASSMFGTELA